MKSRQISILNIILKFDVYIYFKEELIKIFIFEKLEQQKLASIEINFDVQTMR